MFNLKTTQTNGEDPVIGKVYCTTDYDKFTFLGHNRDVINGHVETMKASLEKAEGWLLGAPMMVKRNGNGKLAIIDGQHRYMAAKAEGWPIYYMETTSALDAGKQMVLLNQYGKKWDMKNFIDFHEANGTAVYKRMKHLMNDNNLTARTVVSIMQLCHRKGHNTFREQVKSGTIGELDLDWMEIENRCTWLAILSNCCESACNLSKGKSDSFVFAISKCFQNPEFKPERLEQQFIKYPGQIQKRFSVAQYLEMFDNIYNYKCQQKYRIDLKNVKKRSITRHG